MTMKKNLIYRIIALPIFVVAAIPFTLIHLVKWCIEYAKRGKDAYALMKPVGEGEKAARDLIYAMKEEAVTRVVVRTMEKAFRDIEKAGRDVEDANNRMAEELLRYKNKIQQ